MTAEEETYSDPFAALQTSPPSSSPPPESKDHTKTQAPKDKQQKKKKTEPGPKHAESAPLPKVKTPTPTIHTKTTSQPTPPSLKKKVSFPDTLTRGRGSSYTPLEDDKAVRFSTSLVRGEGPSYNERVVKRDASNLSTNDRRASSPQRHDSDVSQSVLDERLNDIAAEVVDAPDDQPTATEFDIEFDSDDSFTDVVHPIKAVEAVETAPVHGCDPVHHRHHDRHCGQRSHLPNTLTSKRSSGSIKARISDNHGSYMPEVVDNGLSSVGFGSRHKTSNSIPERDLSFSELDSSDRVGSATAPTYSRRGHRLRPSAVNTSILGRSSRRSWPEPIFIWKDTTTTSGLGGPNPSFALRERSESQRNIQASGRPVVAKSSRDQPGRKHQSSRVVDHVTDGTIRYDSTSKRTY
ncbi:MAG: hypothetical protein Q9226_000218 [Calogaya cf. arnoldii]